MLKRSVIQFVNGIASLQLTLVILVITAIAVIVSDQWEITQTWTLALPLSLLTLNLCVSIVTSPKFRRQVPLLLFHLFLLAVLVFAVIGRMTYLVGKISMTETMAFKGVLDQSESGPWHKGNLSDVYFVNEGFDTAYVPRSGATGRMFRESTHNQISWLNEKGDKQHAVIGDDHPLVLQGYRFYTTPNMGFAMQFVYYPNNKGLPHWGEIYLNPFLAYKDIQGTTWELPDKSETVWCFLEIEGDILNPDSQSYFKLPNEHQITIGYGDQGSQRQVLEVGESIYLSSGKLKYMGLTTWMGYRVVYDWTLNWIAAASFLALVSLAWFYWDRFLGRTWLKGNDRVMLDE